MVSTRAGVDRPTRAGVESVKSAGVDKKARKAWLKRGFLFALLSLLFWLFLNFKPSGLPVAMGAAFVVCLVVFVILGLFSLLKPEKTASIAERLGVVKVEPWLEDDFERTAFECYKGRKKNLFIWGTLAAGCAVGFFWSLGLKGADGILAPSLLGLFALLFAFVGGATNHTANQFPEVEERIRKRIEKASEQPTLFGAARVANVQEMQKAGFNSDLGLYVGEYQCGETEFQHVFYDGDCHAITQAPNRSGKGRTVLIPHLAHYSGSMVVNDIKGENAYITAQWRRDRLGQKVYILNPYGLFEDDFKAQGFKTARFNPLASFDPSAKDFILRIDTLAADLVKSHDPRHDFWTNSARQLVGGYLRFLVETKKPADRNICDLYGFFKRAQAGGDMFMDELRGIFETCSAGVRDELGCLQNPSDEVLKFINSAVSDLAFMRDPALRDSLSGDDFDFRDFKRKASTLYIIAPPDGVQRRDMWLRLVVASGLSLLGDVQKGRGLDTLFLLDEAAVLGYMESIASRYALLAGYGVRFWLVFQSLGQVKEHYPKQWESFLDNAGFAQFFTPNNMETAEYISKRAGNRTVSVQSTSTGADGKSSKNESLKGVPLWSPQDVLGLPRNQQIIFAPNTGGYPISIDRGNYDENPAYKGLNRNPYV